MVFRQFAILLFAFGLLNAAASSSTSEISTTAASEISTSSGTASEISGAAASEISTTAASEISTSSGTASEISGAAASEISTTAAEGSADEGSSSQNPATTTTTTAQPAYEQSVSFKVDNISAFADSFNLEDFKNDAVKDSSNDMDVKVSVAVKLAFTASYVSAEDAKTNVAAKLGISEDNVEVADASARRLKSSTRRLSTPFSVTATATLDKAADVSDIIKSDSAFSGLQTEVVVTVKIFAKSDKILPTPTFQLKSAASDLSDIGVDTSSITVTVVTGQDVDDAADTTTSNSVLPWVFTSGLVGIVALF